MRPIFCGNLDFDARQGDVERLFRRYGKVERVDVKSGFAFVYMDDERDAEYAIRRLDRTEFGRKGRRLRIEWTKHERGIRKPVDSRRPSANTKPSKTLFVINFDPIHTRTRDLERHFDPYGKIVNIRIRRNFAFIQYESQEDATKALEATNSSKFMDRVISVEYAVRDDDDRRNGHSPDRRGRDMSPERRSNDRGRSPSPYRRDRASPDYGHGSRISSRSDPRRSPDYERAESPINDRSRPSSRPEPRRSPSYERAASPVNDRSRPSSKREPRRSPSYERDASPVNDRSRPSSKPEPRRSPSYERAASPVNDRYRSRSPPPRERSRS
ncbi:PREDICTED: serine/arginine-rich splicing factor [Prunus dulcis]|uniref:PREDICTED: serine/arginine-rich splicing factor n=2 Tax=Prunus dulcis TaxID=3755 RepID=A0A5E4EVA2_PRUDU|nr:serine/arginine-rich splicing factor RS41-like isoform X1 [Prunus dulcis]VVA19412.1 PREDICTED: serine/arginine-rich splicing factor [Prunus dulcis]